MQPVCEGDFVYRDVVWNAYTRLDLLQKAEQFVFRPDDIVVCTFPRSGTTLTQEIIWQIVNIDQVTRDKHFDNIDARFPFLEFNHEDFYDSSWSSAFDVLENAPSPRLIKTHIPYRMLREQLQQAKPRIVIVMRNPKDVAVSNFNFCKTIENFNWTGGPFSEFLGYFLQGRTFCGDFFEVNKEWWSLRHQENVLILRYEDLVKQPLQVRNSVPISNRLTVSKLKKYRYCMHGIKIN